MDFLTLLKEQRNRAQGEFVILEKKHNNSNKCNSSKIEIKNRRAIYWLRKY
ncbi:hypothetical protein AsAng_0014470 [Aureispira anguillae]|uniref:Uncharacterized protein n=1 Tax=Aureispira anguillae TaxID=2864201 RepID=A0A915YCW5_9BACT|nr:hypothetical protein AsAng_0014470 [Aureispira anguillae]